MIDPAPDSTERAFDPAHFAPGTHGCHEALHTAHLLAELVDLRLAEHPAVRMNAEWKAMADRAAKALNDLYQAIGAAHLGRGR